jgi:hypothetical protein
MTLISLSAVQCQVTRKLRVAKALTGYRMVVQQAEKRRLRRAASRLRGCYLAFLAALAALHSLASLGAE